MRLALQHLDARGLHVDLPATPFGKPRRLSVQSAEGLQGTLDRTGERLAITELQADELLLDALQLSFGGVSLAEDTMAVFRGLRGQYVSDAGALDLELFADEVRASLLGVEAGAVHVQGRVEMRGVRLSVSDGKGSIEAETLRVDDFGLRTGAAVLHTTSLEGRNVRIGWGAPGFRLVAASLRADQVDLGVGPIEVRGQGWALRELALAGSDIRVGALDIEGAEARAALSPEGRREEQRRAPEGRAGVPPLPSAPLNWDLLDGLSGDVNVDVHVDLAVPVLGSRKATHRFRVPVRAGSIDYMRLEGDLSILENVLLDFAVRDGNLVLERGIPLLPTRGHGKPLVTWRLDEPDLALARDNRVRLAVLPSARPARDAAQEEPRDPVAENPSAEEESAPRLALRKLGVDNIDLRLSLSDVSPEPRGIVRKLAFDALTVRGAAEYTSEGVARPGTVEVEASNLDTSLADLPLGGSVLALERLHLESLAGARARLWGLRPQQLELELGAMSLKGLHWVRPSA